MQSTVLFSYPPSSSPSQHQYTEEDETRGQGGVCRAAWEGNLKVLQGLVEEVRRGKNEMLAGYGPLHFAASLNNVDIVNFLLENGMDKNARDAEGNTPLMWAVASNGSEELMEAFVDHGADVNIQNYAGETALYRASQLGMVEKVEFLLENGANVFVTTMDGATALHAAAAVGDEEIVEVLAKHGAPLNARDHEGDTALHWAVREEHPDCVRLLVALGASLALPNEDGETPLDLASSCQDQAMVMCIASLLQAVAGNKSWELFYAASCDDNVQQQPGHLLSVEMLGKELALANHNLGSLSLREKHSNPPFPTATGRSALPVAF
ncbi:COR domain-containing protein [Balamuthia mandrillaris]